MDGRAAATIDTWREEIAGELAEAEAELVAANEALLTAEEAARSAQLERQALSDALAQTDLPRALGYRRDQREIELRNAEGQPQRLQHVVKGTTRRIADLSAALAQLEQLGAAPAAAEPELVTDVT